MRNINFIPIEGAINSQLWFSRRHDEFDISASLEINEPVFADSLSLEEISGRARYVGKNLTNGSLKIENVVVKSTEKVFEISDLELLLDRNDDRESAAIFLPSTSIEDLLIGVDIFKSFTVIPPKTRKYSR